MVRSALLQRPLPALFTAACLGAVACGQASAPGEVILLISTDLAVPTDVDTLHVTLTRSGESTAYFDESYDVSADPSAGPSTKQLPGTFALVASAETDGLVHVHLELLLGKKNGSIRVQRDAEVQIPTEGTKQLATPLDFLCLGATLRSACAAGTTCQASKCVDDKSPALADYVPLLASACFDAATCFGAINMGNSTLPIRDPTLHRCAITGSQVLDATNVNVALVVDPAVVGSYGVCDPTFQGCLVPLDQGPEGWQTLKDDSGHPVAIGLPDAVCDAIGKSVLRVAVSSSLTCGVKDASRALCPASAHCLAVSEVCPSDLLGYSCGSAKPDVAVGGYCAEANTDPMTGPLVPGLWCCNDLSLAPPSPPMDKLLIDDMSGGGPYIKIEPPGKARDGGWFSATDDRSAMLSPPPAPALFTYRTIEPVVTPIAGAPTISHAACLSSPGFNTYYAMEGFNFLYGPPNYDAAWLDVSSYTGISFWAYVKPGKLDLPTAIDITFDNVDTYSQVTDSTCVRTGGVQTCASFGEYLTLTSDWARYTVHWKDLQQELYDGAQVFSSFDERVYTTGFVVSGPSPFPFDFCVAQVEFTTD